MSALMGAAAAAGPLAAGWGAHGVWMCRRLDRARRDPLTGLHTRAVFERTAVRLLNSGPAVLLAVDLNDFKAVNDRHGHAAGDAAIRHSADRMVRWLAIVSPRAGIVARLGGDEFALALPAPGSLPAELDALHAALLTQFEYEGRWLSVGASVGATTATPGEDYSSMLRRADEAMYVAKQNRAGVRIATNGDARPTVAGRRAGRSGTHTS